MFSPIYSDPSEVQPEDIKLAFIWVMKRHEERNRHHREIYRLWKEGKCSIMPLWLPLFEAWTPRQ